jgi:hypothetical protein
MGWFEYAPLGMIWLALSLALLIAMAIGYAGSRLLRRRRERSETSENQSFLLSAALALLGLLIAFTFSMASARFDARRQALLEEANAVGTTYLRFQMLEEPYRSRLSADMLSYLDARRAFLSAGADLSAVERADEATGAVENRIWATLTDWIPRHPTDTANVSLMQATNDMFDLAASDRVVRETRVPLTIIRAIVMYSFIAALLLGQSFAARNDRNPFAAIVVFILVALSIALILDLDRPATGTITVSTTPFDRAVASIRAMEAAKAAR